MSEPELYYHPFPSAPPRLNMDLGGRGRVDGKGTGERAVK